MGLTTVQVLFIILICLYLLYRITFKNFKIDERNHIHTFNALDYRGNICCSVCGVSEVKHKTEYKKVI